MNIEDIKHAIDVAAGKYKDLDPVYQKLITTLAGAGVGTGVGSISLGKDKSGKKRGYLFGGEKGNSRVIGGLAGALAGLHVPTVKKAAETAAVAPSKKPAEKKAAFDWDAIKQKLTEAKQWYEGQNPETRALIGAGVGLGGGALLGKLMGRTGTGAVAGAVAGAGAGAYWKELKKVIEATKPIASDAAKKTKDRVSQLMQKVRPKSTQGEKAPSGERDAIEKAVSASLGGYADRFMKDWERTQAEGLPPQGVNIVVR